MTIESNKFQKIAINYQADPELVALLTKQDSGLQLQKLHPLDTSEGVYCGISMDTAQSFITPRSVNRTSRASTASHIPEHEPLHTWSEKSLFGELSEKIVTNGRNRVSSVCGRHSPAIMHRQGTRSHCPSSVSNMFTLTLCVLCQIHKVFAMS